MRIHGSVDRTAFRSAFRQRDVTGTLTERETQVLTLMAEGRTNAAICERLDIGLKTVEAHVNTIFSKLGLEPAQDDNRRVLAVLAFLRRTETGPAS